MKHTALKLVAYSIADNIPIQGIYHRLRSNFETGGGGGAHNVSEASTRAHWPEEEEGSLPLPWYFDPV